MSQQHIPKLSNTHIGREISFVFRVLCTFTACGINEIVVQKAPKNPIDWERLSKFNLVFAPKNYRKIIK